MKILLVKTSSMGDVVHTLTAVREAITQRPGIHIDWLVESSFADVVQLAQQNGDIRRVIPIHFRQWRKRKPFGLFFHPDIRALKQQLRRENYELVLDAQGLLKSVFLARLANAPVVGFDRHSAREGLVAYFYKTTYAISKNQHAIQRLRQLFAKALDYPLLPQAPSITRAPTPVSQQVLLLHGTTWDNKRYPTAQWHDLAQQLVKRHYQVIIPHHGTQEKRVAQAIANNLDNVTVLPEQSIHELIPSLQSSAAVISVDTGLAHLAVYLGIPTVMLFGPTRPELTGGLGKACTNLVGDAADTASMKRIDYAGKEAFSASMQAIPVNKILDALKL